MVIITDDVTVMDKGTSVAKNKEGVDTTYYNITVGGMGFSNRIGVPKDVYDNVEVGEIIKLKGQCGFSQKNGRFWYFDTLVLGK